MDMAQMVEIDEAKKVVDDLIGHGFEIAAALWLQDTFDYKWYFYIVSPLVDSIGIQEARFRLYSVRDKIPQPVHFDLHNIRLIGPSDPLGQDVISILSHAIPRWLYPRRWRGPVLGNRGVENAYIYPIPASTPT